jgi:sugar phosphate isomerase/epimerase
VTPAGPVVAINTLAWHGHAFEVAFAEIAALGACWVEPALIGNYYPEMTDVWFSGAGSRGMRARIAANGLGVAAVGAHMDLGRPGARDAFLRRIDFAAGLDALFVHTNTARASQEQEFLATLEELIPASEAAGLTICLENPGDGDGEVRLEQDLAAALPFAAHLHLKEIAPDKRGRWRFVAIGSGVTDYAAIPERIEALPVAIELPLRHHRGADWKIAPDPAAPPVPLDEIREVLSRSLRFVHAHASRSLNQAQASLLRAGE